MRNNPRAKKLYLLFLDKTQALYRYNYRARKTRDFFRVRNLTAFAVLSSALRIIRGVS